MHKPFGGVVPELHLAKSEKIEPVVQQGRRTGRFFKDVDAVAVNQGRG